MNKIISLSKVFTKEYVKNLKIFKKGKNGTNKNSILLWLAIILLVGITFLSYHLIDLLISTGIPEIFLNIYLVILAIFLLFQASMTAINVYFYSKDLEYILPLPIKPYEMLIAKFNTLLLMIYIGELVLGFIPLTLYGLMVAHSLVYFIFMIAVLIVFPLLIVILISLITILLMKIFNFIKNKNILQLVVTVILLLGIFYLENYSVTNFTSDMEELNNIENVQEKENALQESYESLGNNFIIVNPSIEALNNTNGFLSSFLQILKIVAYSAISMVIFVLVSSKIYLKIILSNVTRTKRKSKNVEKIKLKSSKKGKAYIKKEIKMLFRRPTFFMQTIFPVIFILITVILIVSVFIPLIDSAIQNDEDIRETLAQLSFNMEVACYILIALQVLFSISTVSLTAISREGKDAILIKYAPIDLYKQFLYKNVLQFILNIIVSVVVLGLLLYLIPDIGIVNTILIFLISIFTNLINSYTMLLVDLRKPNINWNSEYEVTKNSDKKSFQYGFMIIMVLILLYIGRLLENLNIVLGLTIEIAIFAIIFIIYNIILKKKINKVFNKIM